MSHNCPRVQDRKVVKELENAKKTDVEKAAAVTEFAGQGILYLAPPIPGGLHRSPGGLVESRWTPPGIHLIDYKCYYIT